MTSTPTPGRTVRGRDSDLETEAVSILPNATDETSDHCRRCGRPLRSKLAIEAQLGATCAMRQAADWWQPSLDLEAVGHE